MMVMREREEEDWCYGMRDIEEEEERSRKVSSGKNAIRRRRLEAHE